MCPGESNLVRRAVFFHKSSSFVPQASEPREPLGVQYRHGEQREQRDQRFGFAARGGLRRSLHTAPLST